MIFQLDAIQYKYSLKKKLPTKIIWLMAVVL